MSDFAYAPTVGVQLSMLKEWSSEASIQAFVKVVMTVVVDMLELQDTVSIAQELTIFALRPDLSVVLRKGVAVGVVEVKPPLPDGAHVLSDPLMANTMADYLRCLKAFSGLKTAFGIATTYTHWRCFWLAGNEADAAALAPPPPVASLKDDAIAAAAAPAGADFEDGDDSDAPNEAKLLNESPPEALHASRVWSWSEKVNTVHFIASALAKMVASAKGRAPIQPFGRHTYLCFYPDTWTWLSVQWSNTKLVHTREPKATWFIMLGEVGHGGFGTVWHACTAAGVGCAIKFQRRNDEDAEMRLQRECDLWNRFNLARPFDAKVIKLAGKAALLMPYMHKMSAAELRVPHVQEVGSLIISSEGF